MGILGLGRPAFLEFLRNLTPQVLLLVVSLSLWVRLDFTEFDLSNWPSTLVFYACVLTLVSAVVANMMQFIDNYFVATMGHVDDRMQVVRRRLKEPRLRLMYLLRYLKQFKWTVVLNVIITMLVIEAGVMAAVILGTRQAIQLVRATG